MPVTSVMGETSSNAATLGKTDLPKDEAPARMCVKPNCFWVATTSGASGSGMRPLRPAFSATKIFEIPLALESCSTI